MTTRRDDGRRRLVSGRGHSARRWWGPPAAAGLVAASLLAPAASSHAELPSGLVTITGQVTDATTGAPIQGACLVLSGPDGCLPEHRTGVDGRYEVTVSGFEGVWLGAYPADADLYHQQTSASVTFTDATEYTVDFALKSAGALTGRVLDAVTRQPLQGVCAGVQPVDVVPPAEGWGSSLATCSDSRGIWTVGRLAPAPYVVTLAAPDRQTSYVPGAASLAQAHRYVVSAGTATKVSSLRLQPGGVLELRGPQASTLDVTVVPAKASDLNRTRTYRREDIVGKDGISRITDLAPGAYTVSVQYNYRDSCYSPHDSCDTSPPWYASTGFDPGVVKPVRVTRGKPVVVTVPRLAYRHPLTVTFPDAAPGSDVEVAAYFPSGEEYVFPTDEWLQILPSDRSVRLTHLPALEMRLRFYLRDPSTENETRIWYGGTDLATAKPLPVGTSALTVRFPR